MVYGKKGNEVMKKLTADQEAQKQARHDRFRTFVKKVAEMQQGERDALASKMLGCITVEGHPLSPRNTCLLALQCPGATIVGGFRQWIKQGRCVRKGEHGQMIWVPSTKTKAGTDGSEQSDTFFLIGTVFDVSQTQALDIVQPEVEQEQQLQAA